MKIAITSDSVCDLSQEQIIQNNIKIMPLIINLGDNSYSDGIDINSQMIFDYFAKTKQLPKTSAINEFQYDEFFEESLKSYDGIVHFTISSKISSCYDSAIKSAKKHKNVFVIDSQNLSTGVGLLVLYACVLRDKGEKIENIVSKIEERKPFVQASFVVERLDYLYKGGRCSAIQLLGANLLKIRPSILVKNGKMDVHKKYRGKMKDVVVDYIKDTLKEFNNYDDSVCFITYSSATDEMLENAKKAVKELTTFKNVYITTAGATITSHCGENTLGILYFNDGNNH